jgi:predicted metal-dependent phosphoesterase TrpH
MFYDLHMHSALSPCADDDMRPTNIVRMALLKGLQLIAVSDHNSVDNQKAIARTAKLNGIDTWLKSVRDKTPNRVDLFGNQLILDEEDQIIAIQPDSLIQSLDANLDECIRAIRKAHGRIVLAHVADRKNGILHQLAFIPKKLDYDGIEITHTNQKEDLIRRFPWLIEKPFFINSDAHTLTDIHDALYEIDEIEIERFWRDEA